MCWICFLVHFLGGSIVTMSCSIWPPLRQGIKFWNGQYNIFKNTTYLQNRHLLPNFKIFLAKHFLPDSDKEKCPYVAYEWSLTKKPPWFFHFLFLSQAFGCFGRGWSDAKSVLKKVIYDSTTAIATWFVKCECRIGLDLETMSPVSTKKR